MSMCYLTLFDNTNASTLQASPATLIYEQSYGILPYDAMHIIIYKNSYIY